MFPRVFLAHLFPCVLLAHLTCDQMWNACVFFVRVNKRTDSLFPFLCIIIVIIIVIAIIISILLLLFLFFSRFMLLVG